MTFVARCRGSSLLPGTGKRPPHADRNSTRRRRALQLLRHASPFELRLSKQRLQSITGAEVTAIALPGGRGGERERDAAVRAGYWHFLNSAPGVNSNWKVGKYLQRLPITGDLTLQKFADLVQWRGLAPRVLRARYETLAQAKQMLGNRAYERWRERVVLR